MAFDLPSNSGLRRPIPPGVVSEANPDGRRAPSAANSNPRSILEANATGSEAWEAPTRRPRVTMPVSASGRQAGPVRKGFHTKAATHTTVRLYRTNRQAGKIGMEPLFQPAGGRGHSLSHGQGVVRPAVQIRGLFLWPTRQPEGGPPPLSQRVGTPDALMEPHAGLAVWRVLPR
jgi:hypothetical protein